MKWRNTKERELLTSSSANTNLNSIGEGTESIPTNKHSSGSSSSGSSTNTNSNEKNDICVLSNDCYDCSHDKEEKLTYRPSFNIDHDETSRSHDDGTNDGRK